MPLRDDLLNPIPGENPSGVDLRYDSSLIFDQIKEAQRQDDDLAQGDWKHERKVADYLKVIKLTQDALATKSKDLRLAAWLSDASLRSEGFPGLLEGLTLCSNLIQLFWDTLYPVIEDGEMEDRAAPLNWLGSALDMPLKASPIVRSGYDWFKFKESRAVGSEDDAKTEKDKKTRAKLLAAGKLTPELFDKAFVETPKVFYLRSEKDLDGSLEALKNLNALCDQKFGTAAPSFGHLQKGLEEVRHTIHMLLEKKRETEPDPPPPPVPVIPGASGEAQRAAASGSGAPGSSTASFELGDTNDATAAVAKVAAFLRNRDPHSPAPYLMMRGLRWGELRAAAKDPTTNILEAPPTEVRQQVKKLALEKRWAELLQSAENAMALPCSRAWLDLQRLVVSACTALGAEYDMIGSAITSELRALLNDLPELLEANLLDDTPAANAETKAWLMQLRDVPAAAVISASSGEGAAASSNGNKPLNSWLAMATDPYALAQEALKAGHEEKAFQIMRHAIADQRSGRGRFERKMQLVELSVAAGKDGIAQPLLDDLAAAIETHKLDDWEDPQMVAAALATVMKVSKKIQGNAGERQKLFERICRLDPVRALSSG